MKRILFGLLLATAFSSTVGLAREFTDAQGRKLEADIVSLDGAQVTLKRAADGRHFTVPATTFSAADQDFIRAFAAENITYNFEVKNTRERLGKSVTKENNEEIEKEEWSYKIDLRNISRANADNVTVSYWVFVRADDGGKTKAAPRLIAADSIKEVTILKAAQYQFVTKPVTLTKTKLDANYYYTDGTKNKAADSMGGFVVAIMQGDKRIFEYATSPDLAAAAKGTPKASTPDSASGN
jgi:predicted outer membrane lipoprotein